MENNKHYSAIAKAFINLKSLFNIRKDMDETQTVSFIRENVNFQSANAWTLIFAIFIASIGLNMNSAAVIIGAMLISPLMGPIVGAGLALAIYDFELLKRSLRNLGYAVLISLLTSALYFLISPLSAAHSELLARTRPTFYDVLIAIFGGAAGIVALSRKEKGNAIPGVAIATALIPPLCTAGYGIASGKITYFIGAFYLFIINSVFICLSTYLFVRYMRFNPIATPHAGQEERLRKSITWVAMLVMVPSLVLAFLLHKESLFQSRAEDFIKTEIHFDKSFLVDKEISSQWNNEKIVLSFVGETLSGTEIKRLKEKTSNYSLRPDQLVVRQASLEESLEKKLLVKANKETQIIADYENKLSQKEALLSEYVSNANMVEALSSEVTIVNSKVHSLQMAPDLKELKGEEKVYIYWKFTPTKVERRQIENFIKRRLDIETAIFIHSKLI